MIVTVRMNEYSLRRFLRLMPIRSGMGEVFEACRQRLKACLDRAVQYRRLNAIEDHYYRWMKGEAR